MNSHPGHIHQVPLRRGIWAVVACLVLAVIAARAIRQHSLEAQLLRLPPDALPAASPLVRLAVSRGESAFSRHCAACHGNGLQGNPAQGVPNLVDDDWLYGSGRASELERTILYGIRAGNSKGWDLANMPAFGTATPYVRYAVTPLTPGQVDDVVQYVLHLGGRPADAAALERGGKLFHDTEVGTCADCHSSDGKGDAGIGAPNLTDSIWLRGHGKAEDIRDTIEHGLSGSCPAWIGRLPMADIRALAIYLHMAAIQHTGRPSTETRAP